MLDHERRAWGGGISLVAGLDEAGRGPLAGPVVAAAVAVERDALEALAVDAFRTLNDSKKLPLSRRESLYALITSRDEIIWSVGLAGVEEIDRLNILNATHLAMRRAATGLRTAPGLVLIDGLPVRDFPLPSQAIVGGDGSSYLIAAASVVAKVTRDRMMAELDMEFPGYGLARHKGYGTREHLEALGKLGPSPCHRKTFRPISQLNLF